MSGKKLTQLIAAVNAVLAVISVIITPDFVIFCVRMLMCLALFLGAPRIKLHFTAGAAVCVFLISGVWAESSDSGTVAVIVSIIDSACLIVSALILLVDRNISEYLESKQSR